MFWFFKRDEDVKLRIMAAEIIKQRLEIQRAQALANASIQAANKAASQCLNPSDIDAHVQFRIKQALDSRDKMVAASQTQQTATMLAKEDSEEEQPQVDHDGSQNTSTVEGKTSTVEGKTSAVKGAQEIQK